MGLVSNFLFVKGLYNVTTDTPSQRACDRRTARFTRTHVRFTRTHGQGERDGDSCGSFTVQTQVAQGELQRSFQAFNG